jgi:predicted dehydrogenase
MALRVAVAGLGSRGRDWIREVRADPAFELVAVVDTDAAVLAEAAAQHALPRCFDDLETALERTACDAVIVATGPDTHDLACRLACERGLAVLVEKPFALRLDDAIRLVELAERKGVPLLVGQNYRYMRAHRTARRLVREGVLGSVRLLVGHYYRVPHRLAPSLERLPHSVLWGVGVHHLDVMRHVLGQDATGVAAQSFSASSGTSLAGASLQAMLTFAGGTRAVYTATYESTGHEFFEGGQEFYLRYVGERATLHVVHRWLILCERGRLPRLVRRGRRETTEERALLRQLERAVLHGEHPDASGRDNLQTMAILEACVRSAVERAWIDPQALLRDRSR